MEKIMVSTLTLLVPRIVANNVNFPFALDNFAVFANSFDAGSNFHVCSLALRRKGDKSPQTHDVNALKTKSDLT